jgi:hypothetical protein
MSTDISDLPGSELEFVDDNEYTSMDMHADTMELNHNYQENNFDTMRNTFENTFETNDINNSQLSPEQTQNNSEPVLSFKKKFSLGYTQTFLQTIKKELNLSNLLLLLVIFFSATSNSNEYVRKLLNIIPFTSGSGYSHMSVLIIKSALLLIMFLLVKRFVLPYFN